MNRCWVPDCTEEPFLQVGEIFFDKGEGTSKIGSTKDNYKDELDLWLCAIHYLPKASDLITVYLNILYDSNRLEESPERWFLVYKNPAYVVYGSVIKKET